MQDITYSLNVMNILNKTGVEAITYGQMNMTWRSISLLISSALAIAIMGFILK